MNSGGGGPRSSYNMLLVSSCRFPQEPHFKRQHFFFFFFFFSQSVSDPGHHQPSCSTGQMSDWEVPPGPGWVGVDWWTVYKPRVCESTEQRREMQDVGQQRAVGHWLLAFSLAVLVCWPHLTSLPALCYEYGLWTPLSSASSACSQDILK